jgi:antitoxin component YwqK of YwqJK toxin-antitoxin module
MRHLMVFALASASQAESASNPQVETTDPRLTIDNGIYRVDGAPYTGAIATHYPGGVLKELAWYQAGQQHGLTSTFYATGIRRDERWYQRSKAHGNHRGWWPTGLRKFDFTYVADKRESIHRQWYATGVPYTELTFHLDREDGMQRAFRENGKPYINYEVKDGYKYGLSKSGVCRSLENGQVR